MAFCCGLTLADFQVPIKLLCHSTPQLDRGRKTWQKACGQDKDKGGHSAITVTGKTELTQELSLIHYKSDQSNEK